MDEHQSTPAEALNKRRTTEPSPAEILRAAGQRIKRILILILLILAVLIVLAIVLSFHTNRPLETPLPLGYTAI